MSTARLFTPGEAHRITGVSPETALAWRRRGLWTSGEDGKHVRYDLRGLCALKLVRALIEAGIPIGSTVETIGNDFLDPMQNALLATRRKHLSTAYAVILKKGDALYRVTVFDLANLAELASPECVEWDTTIIINLGSLAREMAAFGALD
ncbi:MerR family transcriptional regulator [Methylobacterium sp. HMF5984]|uniref:MerR family transcriptional regulator n=1 Tax=Methylobacterium sp. HMF5984 TaxID=3367370 RepID=UPI003854A100